MTGATGNSFAGVGCGEFRIAAKNVMARATIPSPQFRIRHTRPLTHAMSVHHDESLSDALRRAGNWCREYLELQHSREVGVGSQPVQAGGQRVP